MVNLHSNLDVLRLATLKLHRKAQEVFHPASDVQANDAHNAPESPLVELPLKELRPEAQEQDSVTLPLSETSAPFLVKFEGIAPEGLLVSLENVSGVILQFNTPKKEGK